MANFGSFEYGTSVVYGPVPGPSVISEINILDKNVIQVVFSNNVLIDDNLLNADNYTIEFADNLGYSDVSVKKVFPHNAEPAISIEGKTQREDKVTTRVDLLTDVHTSGQGYRITVSNINSAQGDEVPSAFSDANARRTKMELILRNVPSRFDKRPGSIVRTLLTSIGIEDDRIGGNLDESIFVEPTEIEESSPGGSEDEVVLPTTVPYAGVSGALSLVSTENVTLDGSGMVESWASAGAGISMSWSQSTSANRPGQGANDDIQLVAGGGSDGHWLTATHSAELDFVSDPGDATIVIVANWPAQPFSGTKQIWGTRAYGDVSANGGWAFTASNFGSDLRLIVRFGNGGSGVRQEDVFVPRNVHHVCIVRKNSAGALDFRVDGVSESSSTGWSFDTRGGSAESVIAAEDSSGGDDASIDIYAMAAIPSYLSDAECVDIEDWAETEFGITLGA